MNSNRPTHRSARSSFISMKAAIVLAVIALSASLLAYEWHHVHPPKAHHSSATSNHHHKNHEAKRTATN